MTLAQDQARFAAATTYEQVPSVVSRSVEHRFLDTLGIALAACGLETSHDVAALAADWGGKGEASAIGVQARLPAPAAAFVLGTLAHSLDFDDTHLPSILHPSATIVPAALAAGQACGATGRETIAAAAAAYEICIRLGMAAYDPRARNNVFFERGLHATSICGTIAAAVAAGKLGGLDEVGLCSAIGIAASMGAGLLEANRTGGTVKRVHCGWAAHAGVYAAALAARGLTGPTTVLEGRFGFFHALCGDAYDPAVVCANLGEQWEIPGIFFKPYPANHFTHAGIDAAIALRAEGLPVEEIERIELGVASPTLRTIAEPREAKARPSTGYAAQFSGPFTVATALLGGSGLGVGLEDFTDERVHDERLLSLAARVNVVADAECDARYPYSFPAVLRVTLRSGEIREHRVINNRGGHGSPLTEEELRLKFRLNAERVLAPQRVDQLEHACLHLNAVESLDELTSVWEGK